MTQNITPANLAQFYGSEQLYHNPLCRGIRYTEGVRFLNHEGAGWLVDAILSHATLTPKVKREEFIVATLKVNLEKHSALLTFDDGNDHIVATQVIEYTDFPLEEIVIYKENNVLMLPSER